MPRIQRHYSNGYNYQLNPRHSPTQCSASYSPTYSRTHPPPGKLNINENPNLRETEYGDTQTSVLRGHLTPGYRQRRDEIILPRGMGSVYFVDTRLTPGFLDNYRYYTVRNILDRKSTCSLKKSWGAHT